MYDIETLEQQNDRNNEDIAMCTVEEAVLRPVSIGCSSSIMNEDKFFLRDSSHPDDAYSLVDQFMDYLFELVETFRNQLPSEIISAKERLENELEDKSKFSKAYCEKSAMLRTLQSYCSMSIYGFNSCKLKFFL